MKFSEIIDNLSINRITGDTISIGTLLGTLAGWLPNIASIVTIVWMLIRIYETKTVQKFLGRSNDIKQR